MPGQSSFDYALIRVVPRVEREEFINAGLIFICLEQNFLAAHVQLDAERLHALWPEADEKTLRRQLDSFPAICRGEQDAGDIARLSRRERFHWLTAPRSTTVQTSAVHTGLCQQPEATFTSLIRRLLPR